MDVSYDRYSLLVDGRRVIVQSAEFHYFRLPSPDLWRDILEKEKAAGFNAVSVYFHWAFHSPAPGVYDFTGVRDVDRLLRVAAEAGLWVIARPGPYINAETTGGGFPAWLKLVPGRARSSAPGYTAAYREWLAHLNPIIARHQVTRGGSVLLYNIENEYATNTDAAYMQDLQDVARSAGIDVPTTTNLAGLAVKWDAGPGAVDIPGVDDYPQGFDCFAATWGPAGPGITERIRDDAPVFAAEYQAGAIDQQNGGYAACRLLTGVEYTKYFPKGNLIRSGATLVNHYMGFGGTNWGWLAQPNDVYTSYDYGAAITEARQLTDKYQEYKRQGYFLRAATLSLASTDAVPYPRVDGLETAARANPSDGAVFVLVRNPGVSSISSTLSLGGVPLPVTVPAREAKVLVAGYPLGAQHLVASTSEILTHEEIGGRDVAVLYGTWGTNGTTILRYAAQPRVTVFDGKVDAWFSDGDLRLDYRHTGLARVLIRAGGRRPLLLLLGTDDTAAAFWRADTTDGPVLVHGTALLRSAAVHRGTLALRADTAAPGPVEIFTDARAVTVNGSPLRTRPTASGSLQGTLPGPRPVDVPPLTGWRQQPEAPESAPGFDDSDWTEATKTASLSPLAPVTLPVLFSDEYGFHTGSVWYRGRFTATSAAAAVSLHAVTGKRGNYLVWLNGHYLGAAPGGTETDAFDPPNPLPGPGEFAVPDGVLRAGAEATLSVLVQNMGHNDDWTAEDLRQRQPRGLVGARVGEAVVSWRIQGAARVDPARGGLNNGGLFGERAGWSLPGHPDRDWPLFTGTVPAGVTWLRAGFTLDLPAGQDTSLALRFPGSPPGGHRAIVYLNGWQVGQYGAEIGPQTDFVLPAGVLREDGPNTLAIAVIATGPSAVATPHLIVAGTQWGGVSVTVVPAPDRI